MFTAKKAINKHQDESARHLLRKENNLHVITLKEMSELLLCVHDLLDQIRADDFYEWYCVCVFLSRLEDVFEEDMAKFNIPCKTMQNLFLHWSTNKYTKYEQLSTKEKQSLIDENLELY